MANLVAFDTNICVWGILQLPGVRDNLVSRTRALIKSITDNGGKILISAPVLGELLVGVPIGEQAAKHDAISQKVRIYPFDSLCAETYAEMMYRYHNGKSPTSIKQFAKEGRIPRQKVKVDYMIAAIAVANKCDCLYTDDSGLRAFAEPYITVLGVPTKSFIETQESSTQTSLFDLLE
ncbi:MAG: PIN domain-containing protein [Proteobacteria bacterium]|nr:MAG: PIN domain-containing protein [Pseudomonadota bacterium]